MISTYDKNRVAERFARQSKVYESVTPVQNDMAERLMTMIADVAQITNPTNVLDIGCGTGRLTAKLIEKFPNAHVTGIDVADAMIRQARKNVPKAIFIHDDAEIYMTHCQDKLQIIASNAAIQWFDNPLKTIRRCIDALQSKGSLAFATFGDQTFKELRTAFCEAYGELDVKPKKHLLDMPNAAFWQNAIPNATVTEETFELNFPCVKDFLHSVQKAGATHPPSKNSQLTKKVYLKMTDRYKKRFKKNNGIQVTYHAIYVTFVKP